MPTLQSLEGWLVPVYQYQHYTVNKSWKEKVTESPFLKGKRVSPSTRSHRGMLLSSKIIKKQNLNNKKKIHRNFSTIRS